MKRHLLAILLTLLFHGSYSQGPFEKITGNLFPYVDTTITLPTLSEQQIRNFKMLADADNLLELNKDFNGALAKYLAIRENGFSDALLNYNIGLCYLGTEQYLPAIESFSLCLSGFQFFERMNDCFYRERCYAKEWSAYKEVQFVVHSEKRYHNVLEKIGLCYVMAKMYESAIDIFKAAIDYKPTYYSNYWIGSCYAQLENYSSAIDYLNTALVYSDTGEAYYLRGLCKIAIKNGDGCADLKKAYRYGVAAAKSSIDQECH